MKINRKLIETLTKEVILESQLEKKVVVKKKKDLKESEMLNEEPFGELLRAASEFDPAAITALVMSGLPITAAIKVIADTLKKDPKDPSKGLMDRIQAMGKKVQQNR
jgi:hypothetical protein